MEEIKNQEVTNQEITFEQLKTVTEQLIQQNNSLREKLSEKEDALILAKLSYMFKVVELKDSFDAEFVSLCTEDIKHILNMTPSQENTPEEDSTKE